MSINQTFNSYYHRMPPFWFIIEVEEKLKARIKELEEENTRLKSERDKWRGKYNRLKSEFNLLKNKIWTTKK